ncbi:uncharacterized protein [Venturia canescens]|uniref:uncharacterized protein n=1 Tax=Venturia canescens TaxID=32260 RepID=UPI001C9BC9E3|nr:uncharacterized protein LOC122409263 [Venturia canescens]
MSSNNRELEIAYFHMISAGHEKEEEILKLVVSFGSEPLIYWIKPSNKTTSMFLFQNYGLESRDREVFYNDKKLPFVSLLTALTNFLEELQSLSKPILLVSHSAELEAKLLVRSILKCGMIDQFARVIAGFSDTFIILRNESPNPENIEKFTIPTLVRDLLKKDYSRAFHESPYDVMILKEIGSTIPRSKLIRYAKTFKQTFDECEEYLRRLYANRRELDTSQQAPSGMMKHNETAESDSESDNPSESESEDNTENLPRTDEDQVIEELTEIMGKSEAPSGLSDKERMEEWNATVNDFFF